MPSFGEAFLSDASSLAAGERVRARARARVASTTP